MGTRCISTSLSLSFFFLKKKGFNNPFSISWLLGLVNVKYLVQCLTHGRCFIYHLLMCTYLWVEVTYFLAVYEATNLLTSCIIKENSSWNSPCDVFYIVVPFFANILWNIWSLKVAEVLSDTCMFYGMSVVSRCGVFNVIGFFVKPARNLPCDSDEGKSWYVLAFFWLGWFA